MSIITTLICLPNRLTRLVLRAGAVAMLLGGLAGLTAPVVQAAPRLGVPPAVVMIRASELSSVPAEPPSRSTFPAA